MLTRLYAPPHDRVVLSTNDARVLELADRLWERGEIGTRAAPPIRLRVTVESGPRPGPDPERSLRWRHGADTAEAEMNGVLRLHVTISSAAAEGLASDRLLEECPSQAARLLLEAPVAHLMASRGFTVLHASGVSGERGVVVVRGGSRAGKSTLTAAAWREGFGVLGDESLLVSREDADELASSVRDLTLLPGALGLLGLENGTQPAFNGTVEKRRVDLFSSSRPELRRGRRVATLLLGPRDPGPARLVPLSGEEFREEFARGAIPEERRFVDPSVVAEAWARRGGWRLDGAVDLAGSINILKRITGNPLERIPSV